MTLVHLVYIHGFQGNDTTFQSFPTDLQQYLSTHVPPHLDVGIRTSLYPTYKSVKPISFATKNFLEWLSTQPPGPVILLGHSMGGLLAADAATHISNNPDHHPGAKPRRIIGMVAFDTPYLGMHPHVIISGIASLLPKGDDEGKSETDMNDESKVHIVDDKVTDDWDAFKNDRRGHSSRPQSISSFSGSHLNIHSPSPSSHSASPSPRSSPPPLPPRPSRPRSVGTPAGLRSHSPPLIDKAMSFISTHSNDGFVRWIRKHADDPFGASQRWVVERFQFGICMFDPAGLKDRYTRLVGWSGGEWVNYWTQTVPRKPAVKEGSLAERENDLDIADNDAALLETGISKPADALQGEESAIPSATSTDTMDAPVVLGPPTRSEAKAISKSEQKALKDKEKEQQKAQKEKTNRLKKAQRDLHAGVKSGRHFIVLPAGLGQVLGGGERWEKVLIGGVDDEVSAHTGLFIRGQNLDYDGLVEKVGKRILGWCEKM